MNQPEPGQEALPGLQNVPVVSQPDAAPAKSAPRVRAVDRSQLSWQMLDVERLVEPDHAARAIWELVGRLKLDGFYARGRARQRGAHALGSTAIGELVDLCLQPGITGT